MSDARKAIEALRALPTIDEIEAKEEQEWRDACPEYGGMPGWFITRAGLTCNREARDAWTECHDPAPLLALLEAGRADIRSQRLAASIIAQARDERLPRRRVNITWRNRWIAVELYQLRERGFRPGKAQVIVAGDFGVSESTVRKVAARADLRREAEAMAMQMEVEARRRAVG